MRNHLFTLTAVLFVACSQNDSTPKSTNTDADTDADTGDLPTDADPQGEDTGTDPAPEDEEEDEDTAAEDTGVPIPDWVDPEVPDGPIPPTEGTDTTPEDSDFDWTDIGTDELGESLPIEYLRWDEYPQAGTAQVLDWSDSDACVCFDIDCTTCSQDACGAETCTYDLNENHALTKYHIELRATEYPEHAITFEVNVSADPPITYTDIDDVLTRLEHIPVQYWYGLKVITEHGHGIQYLDASYFGGLSGAQAYGSMNYIDTRTANVSILLHELGHTLEQYTRIGDPPVLEPQSNILNPIWRNAIRSDNNRTSAYGSNNEWEDMAEFSRIHALCLMEGSLDELEAMSPERFRIWERVLLNGTTIHP